MSQRATIAKHDKRKRLVLPDDFVAEGPYGEYIIGKGKGHLSIIAIPLPKPSAHTGPLLYWRKN